MAAVAPPLYGLDIETDTTTDGLDPRVARIVAAAVAHPDGERVFTGPEPALLRGLDEHLGAIPPGVLVTWNGAAFDLPFLADRAATCRVPLGLVLVPDRRLLRRNPLPGHEGAYSGGWHGHTHLDAYRLWRNVRLALGVSASLKSVAAAVGLDPRVLDRTRLHELPEADVVAYVASDARLARLLGERAWARAGHALDPAVVQAVPR